MTPPIQTQPNRSAHFLVQHLPSCIKNPALAIQARVSFLFSVFHDSLAKKQGVAHETFQPKAILPFPVKIRANMLAPDGICRTRTDFVTYASQFLSASILASESTFSMLLQNHPEARKTIERNKDRFIFSVSRLLQELPFNAELLGLSQEEIYQCVSEEALAIQLLTG